jgi:hypothetical protein
MAAGATIKHFAICNGVNVELLNRRFAEQFEADDLLLEAQQLILVACVDQFVNRGCSGGEADAVAALIGARPRVSAMRVWRCRCCRAVVRLHVVVDDLTSELFAVENWSVSGDGQGHPTVLASMEVDVRKSGKVEFDKPTYQRKHLVRILPGLKTCFHRGENQPDMGKVICGGFRTCAIRFMKARTNSLASLFRLSIRVARQISIRSSLSASGRTCTPGLMFRNAPDLVRKATAMFSATS